MVRRMSRRRGERFTVAIAGGKGVSIVHVSTCTPSLNYHHRVYPSPCSLPHASSPPWPPLYLDENWTGSGRPAFPQPMLDRWGGFVAGVVVLGQCVRRSIQHKSDILFGGLRTQPGSICFTRSLQVAPHLPFVYAPRFPQRSLLREHDWYVGKPKPHNVPSPSFPSLKKCLSQSSKRQVAVIRFRRRG
jgi:hypothetical protein